MKCVKSVGMTLKLTIFTLARKIWRISFGIKRVAKNESGATIEGF